MALSASCIAACRMEKVRDCAIGFVPWLGVKASDATVFQWTTARAAPLRAGPPRAASLARA
jgi:hypothetical protein